MKLDSSTAFVKRFRLQSDLEKELAALEPQKDNIEEKSDEFSLTLKEIIMKRKEAARIRAQQVCSEILIISKYLVVYVLSIFSLIEKQRLIVKIKLKVKNSIAFKEKRK